MRTRGRLALSLGIVFALGIAILLNLKIPLVSFYRTIFYLPSVISGVAVAVLWVSGPNGPGVCVLTR